MYYLRERSLISDDPTCMKLRSDGLLFPNDRQMVFDWSLRGSYEDSIIQWAKTLIDPSKIFVDIGAHVGTYSVGLAPHCSKVVSFECYPKTFNYLCGNIALRELDDKITPHRTALGNYTGTVTYTFRGGVDGGGNTCMSLPTKGAHSETLPITTLDSFELSNIGLIKLDVEGFEQQVLEGGENTLRRNNYPVLLFESWSEGREKEGIPSIELRSSLFEYLNTLGYKVIPIHGWDEMFLAERSFSDSK